MMEKFDTCPGDPEGVMHGFIHNFFEGKISFSGSPSGKNNKYFRL